MVKHIATSREYAENAKVNGIFVGALYVIMGIVTFICGESMLNYVSVALGIVMILYGALIYIESKIPQVLIINIILGAILIILGEINLAADIIRILFGIFTILSGIPLIFGAQGAVNIQRTGDRVVLLIFGCIAILLGLLSLINYADTFGWVVRITAVCIAMSGVVNIAKALHLIA